MDCTQDLLTHNGCTQDLPMVHLYAFAKSADPEECTHDISRRAVAALGSCPTRNTPACCFRNLTVHGSNLRVGRYERYSPHNLASLDARRA